MVVPEEQFFGFYKNRHILLSDSANCTVLRAVVLTQYRRVTDGQTEGIAVASAALAKRRAVKMREVFLWDYSIGYGCHSVFVVLCIGGGEAGVRHSVVVCLCMIQMCAIHRQQFFCTDAVQ